MNMTVIFLLARTKLLCICFIPEFSLYLLKVFVKHKYIISAWSSDARDLIFAKHKYLVVKVIDYLIFVYTENIGIPLN